MNEYIWNDMIFTNRLALCRACGWANRTAVSISKKVWDNLTPATVTVLNRYYGGYSL